VNEKITLPGLTQLLALQTGDTKKQAEDFVKEFFNVIASSLAEGEQVKIKELGVFKTISVEARKSVNVSTGGEHEIPAHRKAVFVPSKELAALVNEPFEMFETVELNDDFTFDEDETVPGDFGGTDEEPITDEAASEEVAVAADTAEENVETAENDTEDLAPEDVEAAETAEESVAEQVGESVAVQDEELEDDFNVYTVEDMDEEVVEPATSELTEKDYESPSSTETVENVSVPPVISGDSISENDSTQPYEQQSEEGEYKPEKRRTKFWVGFLSGILAACVIGLVAYVCVYGCDWFMQNDKDVAPEVVVEDIVVAEAVLPSADTAAAIPSADAAKAAPVSEAETNVPETAKKEDVVPTAPSDRKVYDTISKTRYLTTMAKDHYGNYNLWPIIYEENKSFLGHPDRIRPGTQVVIPPLSKYGVDPSNPADVAKAKKKGVEIYSRYK
jgi:nucleoid DNA-binding protein